MKLKTALASSLIMRLTDFERQFVVTTDASDVAVGTILKQDSGHVLQPVALTSRELNNVESPYSPYERELLGIMEALFSKRPSNNSEN